MNSPKSSRELAELVFQSQTPGPEIKWGHCSCCDATLTVTAAIIESYRVAWVADTLQKAADIKINNEDGTTSRPAQIFRDAILALADVPPVELKPRTFTEIAEHFTKVTKPVDWPTDEPDVD